jgi:hypothetical protein
MAQLTPEQYQMTQEEMMSGAEGQAAYTARIAALREGRTPASTPVSTSTKAQGSLSPEQIESVKETLKRASEITKTHVYSEPTKNIEADKLEETQIETPTTPPKTEATQQIMTESQAFSNWFQQEQQRIAKEQEAAAKKREEQLAKLETQIEERPSMEKLIEEQREEYKVPEFYDKLVSLTPEIDALNNKLIEVETREQNMLMGAEQRMAPMTFIRGEQALIQRQFAVEKTAVSAELGAKTALAETYKGNINMANTLINQTIEAQLYDYNQKIDDYKYFFDYYDDHYKGLDSELKSNIEKQYNLLMAQEQVEREDLQNKYSLIQSAWQLGIDPALTAQDIKSKSYEEIMSRVGPEIQKVAGTSEIKELMARYPTAGITEDDTYAQAVGKVAEMPEEVQTDAQKIYEASGGEVGTGLDFNDWYQQVYKGRESDLSTAVLTDFYDALAGVSDFGNREEALNYLNNKSTALIAKFGVDKYLEIADEVDRIFPPSPEEVREIARGFYESLFGEGSTKDFIGPVYTELKQAK